MKLTGRFKYLGIENGETKDGKKYTRLGILQGLNSEVLYPNEEVLRKVEKLPPMTEIEASLSITIKADKTAYVAIDDITVVK